MEHSGGVGKWARLVKKTAQTGLLKADAGGHVQPAMRGLKPGRDQTIHFPLN